MMTGSAALLTVGLQPNAMQNAGQWLQCGNSIRTKERGTF
jgi:hypothetical protein